jgi:hypothetical protein
MAAGALGADKSNEPAQAILRTETLVILVGVS